MDKLGRLVTALQENVCRRVIRLAILASTVSCLACSACSRAHCCGEPSAPVASEVARVRATPVDFGSISEDLDYEAWAALMHKHEGQLVAVVGCTVEASPVAGELPSFVLWPCIRHPSRWPRATAESRKLPRKVRMKGQLPPSGQRFFVRLAEPDTRKRPYGEPVRVVGRLRRGKVYQGGGLVAWGEIEGARWEAQSTPGR